MKEDCKGMQFIWAGNREDVNQNVVFALKKEIANGELILFAADFYQVFVNGEFVCYGPERTAAGYARIRRVSLNNVKTLEIKVSSYNVSTYACDKQLPFFGARIICGGEVLAESFDFDVYNQKERVQNVPRYSFQRAFVEVYDYRNTKREALAKYEVEAPQLLNCVGEVSQYAPLEFSFQRKEIFNGFGEIYNVWWKDSPLHQAKDGAFDVVEEVGKKTVGNFTAMDFELPYVAAGFLQLEVDAKEDTKIYLVFDEYVDNGKWIFRRSSCNDCVCYTLPKGKYKLLTFEPYVMKFLKLLQQGEATVKPTFILLQNDKEIAVKLEGENKDLIALYDAAIRSFRPNVTDIYMDGPGRERAGWLFDSRFTAMSEEMLFGNNKIERAFLENYNLSVVPEIDKGMVADCFPAQHESGEFIPNYAMWYVIQVYEYYKRTGDRTIVDGAKEKAYALNEYFQKFINEDGLLEDLQGWVFVEWSIANTKEYVCGVNYPSNMVYAEMLRVMSELYNDGVLLAQANAIREAVLKQSYTGTFFVDNATRENGVLKRRDDHISETCQYYALILGYCPDEAFATRMMEEFGPFRPENVWENVGRSNILPGHYLRFFWLLERGENDRVIEELQKCLHHMYEYSGTLWEKDLPTDSLNHGFTSAAAVILVRALTGYKGLQDGIPVFGQAVTKEYGITVSFEYENYKKEISI